MQNILLMPMYPVVATTLYLDEHKPSVINKIIGQMGFTLSALAAAVITIAALVFLALSLIAYPFSATPFNYAVDWLAFSAIGFGLSIKGFMVNPFMTKMWIFN